MVDSALSARQDLTLDTFWLELVSDNMSCEVVASMHSAEASGRDSPDDYGLT